MTRGPAAHGLTRENLAERTLVTLRRGGWRGPDVALVEADCGRVVVKDFSRRARWLRCSMGRWSIRREERAYRQLAGLAAVPPLLGRLDALALVVAHRGGARFSRRRPWTFSPEFGRQLERSVRELHARGVAHLDLRHRSNVRASTDGSPVLVDFGSAVCFRPGSAGARWLLPLFAWFDRRAVAKWRRRLERQSGVGRASTSADSGIERGASRPT